MTTADLPQVFDVRVSTLENSVTLEYLEELGITPESVAAAIQDDAKGWVCETNGRIVGFAMGDKSDGEVTVLALHPDFEQRGYGKQLLARVRDWLFDAGHEEIWLLTGANESFRAYGFYQAQGWRPTGEVIGEDEKFVLAKPR